MSGASGSVRMAISLPALTAASLSALSLLLVDEVTQMLADVSDPLGEPPVTLLHHRHLGGPPGDGLRLIAPKTHPKSKEREGVVTARLVLLTFSFPQKQKQCTN